MKKVLTKRNDVAFYMKLLPLVQLHPKAYDKSKAIVCEKSNEKALQMLEDAYVKKEISAPACDTKVIDENISLAGKLGIRGTPAIIFEDGRTARGAVSADELIKKIDGK
jgi:thiol:disulfide interchange protein DsbC